MPPAHCHVGAHTTPGGQLGPDRSPTDGSDSRYSTTWRCPRPHTAPARPTAPRLALYLLSASLLTPVASRNLLLYQSLPLSIPNRHVILWRRKDDTGVGTTARGIVERLSGVPRRVPSDGGPSGRVRGALCAPRQLTPYCHTSGLELEGMFQRSTVLPDVERQRGTQHDGKAEGEEKVLKSSFRKTCMVR